MRAITTQQESVNRREYKRSYNRRRTELIKRLQSEGQSLRAQLAAAEEKNALVDATNEFIGKDWTISKKGDLVELRKFHKDQLVEYLHFDSVTQAFAALRGE